MWYNARMKDVPIAVQACLWSYDIDALDAQKDKRIIINNVLNYGTEEATRWVFRIYGKSTIADALAHHPPGSMSRRSLALWSVALGWTFEPRARVLG